MAKKDDRFYVAYKEGSVLTNAGYRQLLVDRKTGVTYLLVSCGYGSSITPLLDAHGQPVITHVDDLREWD